MALSAPIDDAVITWLDCTVVGTHSSSSPEDSRIVNVSELQIDELAADLNSRKTPPPFDGGNVSGVHEATKNSSARSPGWVLGATKKVDSEGLAHLWIKVALHPLAADDVQNGFVLYGSPAFHPGGYTEDGERIPASFHSYALTNTPFVQGCAPHRINRSEPGHEVLIAASIQIQPGRLITMSEKVEPTEKLEGGADMFAALGEMLGMPGASPEELLSAVQSLVSSEGGDSEQLSEDAAQAKLKSIAQEKRIAELEAYVAQAEATRVHQEASQHLASLCIERGLQCDDEERDNIVTLALQTKDPVAAIDTFAKSMRKAPPTGRVFGGEKPTPKVADEGDALAQRITELAAKNPTLSRQELTREALISLSSENPTYGIEFVAAAGA